MIKESYYYYHLILPASSVHSPPLSQVISSIKASCSQLLSITAVISRSVDDALLNIHDGMFRGESGCGGAGVDRQLLCRRGMIDRSLAELGICRRRHCQTRID